MIQIPFELIPFGGQDETSTKIEGSFVHGADSFNFDYSLSQGLDNYLFDLDFKDHQRQDGLWQKSCLEFFIKKWNSSEYIEVNIAPNGRWQAYWFKDYRKDRVEFPGIVMSSFSLMKNSHDLTLSAKFDQRDHPFWKNPNFNLGVSAVLEQKNKKYHYFALLHMGDEPDFHHPDSFMLYF
jgi:hypothetical protein